MKFTNFAMEPELKNFENQLHDLAKKLLDEFLSIRTNRPTTKLVEDIKVLHYGEEIPIKSLASLSISLPRDIIISVWDKGAVGPVSKAIESSGLGMSPTIEGNVLRLTLPALTEERRADLIKLIKKTAEEIRIRVRQMRDEINKKIKKAEDEDQFGESEAFKFKERVQKSVDRTNGEIEKLLNLKIKEISE
ncbi:MAG: ribosome recycling factor [Candidatus Liptonbacteria bacterium]|nr:ribosome recycling factor [Candidatus Liptonbacteria bacterium]